MSSIKRALLSVSDKTGIVELARHLHNMGVEILSTGGTSHLLREQHIPTVDVSDYTGFPEIMSGRVKTLHPKIHGGLLGRRGIDDEIMHKHDIGCIDLVVVNLYPFAKVTEQENCSLAEAIENIDIGGPTMLRSAAKNYNSVTVLVDTADYARIITEMKAHNGATLLSTRFSLAQKVFAHTAYYDALVANYLGKQDVDGNTIDFPITYSMQWIKQQDMRYGENPHQKAAFYRDIQQEAGTISSAIQQHGKPLSFNNIADADTALECVKRFDKAACVIVKHANPCGVALAETQLQAYQRAFSADPTSAFGGIIAFNQVLTVETVQAIITNQFVEAIIAPEIAQAALAVLAQKPNIRVLSCGQAQQQKTYLDYKRVNGGLLIQESDSVILNPNKLTVVTKRQPTATELRDLLFAWEVVKCVKSNAIVYAKDTMTVGIGAGQMSRVFSAKIANMKATEAKLNMQNAVLASDAFFPFRDGVDAAAEAGITAIIQPGGSIRDEEIIQAANAANIAMVFTGIRHFRH